MHSDYVTSINSYCYTVWLVSTATISSSCVDIVSSCAVVIQVKGKQFCFLLHKLAMWMILQEYHLRRPHSMLGWMTIVTLQQLKD